MIWDAESVQTLPDERKSIAQERLLEWAEKTLAIVAAVPGVDAAGHQRIPCPDCGEDVWLIVGRHSGALFKRHARSGCQPNGRWEYQIQKPIETDPGI